VGPEFPALARAPVFRPVAGNEADMDVDTNTRGMVCIFGYTIIVAAFFFLLVFFLLNVSIGVELTLLFSFFFFFFFS
jgi:hypothetical protein